MHETPSSTLLAKLVEDAPVGIVVWRLEDAEDDASLTLALANSIASKIVAQDLSAKIGQRFADVFPLAVARRKLYADVVRTGRPLSIEYESAASGSDQAYAITAVPSGDCVATYFENLDALRLAETNAREASAFLDSLVEHLPLMLFVKDAGELRFERMNRAGEELLGIPRSALLGKNDYDFFPKDQADFFVSADRETLRAGVELDIPEEPIETARGQRWLHTRKVPIADADGRPIHLVGISEDITERRAAARDLQAAKESAEAASRELEAFSYSVAHDLRAPLRAINGFGQALVEDCSEQLGAEGNEFLRRIRANTERMAALIDDLLELSRVTRVALRRERTSLTRLAETTVAHLVEQNPDRVVETVVLPGLVVDADAGLLRILLDNLIGNAFKFSARRPRARIELGAIERDGGLVYFVRDDGVGFDIAHAKKLFAPFERLHLSTDFEGTGIGLAIVKRIVTRHGGNVWCESEIGRGATFYFSLGQETP